MSVGILGTKLGMTQVFDETGRAIPVTVIQAGPCKVTQVNTKEKDGYNAIQLGFKEVKAKSLNKPELGHLAKTEAPPLRHLKEYRIEEVEGYELGSDRKADIFSAGQIVDVIGTSIGKGFAGYQKRHNFGRGPMSHGSKNHRQPGSVGA
ncbi:MAG TPA: 50S ribosomal protein L3, partial [Allocoleopsis sp.]